MLYDSVAECNTYGRKASPVVESVKFHCANTGVKASKKVKMRASLKPLKSDKQRTIGSVTNISKGRYHIVKTSFMEILLPDISFGP